MDKIPHSDEIRQYKTPDLDGLIESAFQSIEKLKENPHVTVVEEGNLALWYEYRNLLLRIADARPASQFYRWFDENSLDESSG